MLVFLPGRRRDPPRAARAGRQQSLPAGTRVLPLYGDLLPRRAGPRHPPGAAGRAQGRARDQHRRDQPHHRGRARRGRRRPGAALALRSRERHEPAGDRAHLARLGRPAPRPRRPARARRVLPPVDRGAAARARAARAARDPGGGPRAAGARARRLGRASRRALLARPAARRDARPGARPAPRARRARRRRPHHRRTAATMAALGAHPAARAHAAARAGRWRRRDRLRAGRAAHRARHPARAGTRRGHAHAARAARPGSDRERRDAAAVQRARRAANSSGASSACATMQRTHRRRRGRLAARLRLPGPHRPLARAEVRPLPAEQRPRRRFADPQALASSEFIVVADLDAGEREARIFLAAPLAPARSRSISAPRSKTPTACTGTPASRRCSRAASAGSARWCSRMRRCRSPTAEAVRAAMLDGIRELGLDALPWTKELRSWQARVLLLRTADAGAREPWPDVGDAALLATWTRWLAPWLDGISRRDHLAAAQARRRAARAARPGTSSAGWTSWRRRTSTVPSGSRIADRLPRGAGAEPLGAPAGGLRPARTRRASPAAACPS